MRDARKAGVEAGPDDRPAIDKRKDVAFQRAWEDGCREADSRDPGFAARMRELGQYITTGAGGLFDPELDLRFPVPGDKWAAAMRWVTVFCKCLRLQSRERLHVCMP